MSAPYRRRRPQDGGPDLLGLRLAHRALLHDARRLAALAERVAAGDLVVDRRRAVAVAGYVGDWLRSVRHHHETEEEVLLPVLAAAAGRHVDLTELSADHAALSTMLERAQRAADVLAAAGAGEVAATALAVELADLRDALVEHVQDEEEAVLPLAARHLSARDWEQVERRARRGARLSFDLSRTMAVATAQERRAVGRRAGPVLCLLLALVGPAARRRERAVFGGWS